MRTEKGRVVYNRKVHLFEKKDLRRIMKAIKRNKTLEKFITVVVEALQEAVEQLGEDYVPAFEYSLKAFWTWITTGSKPAALSRSLVGSLEQLLEEAAAPADPDEDIREILAGYVAAMQNTIEEIENYVAGG